MPAAQPAAACLLRHLPFSRYTKWKGGASRVMMGSPQLGRGFLQGTALHLHSLKLTTLKLVAGVDRDSATSHLRVGSRAARNLDAAGSATSSPRLVRGPAIILALQPTQKCGVAATRRSIVRNIVFSLVNYWFSELAASNANVKSVESVSEVRPPYYQRG